jgi:hypothetical protein
MKREEEVRKKVKILKRFYTDLVNFFLVNAVLTIIWFTFDRTGTFWPKYIIVIWGFALVFKAYRMGVIPIIFPRTSFFNQDWEEKKVRELMRRRDHHDKAPLKKDDKEK